MPQFEYIARTNKGTKQKGKVIAASKREAYEKVLQRGFRVLEMNEVAQTIWNKEISIGNPLKLKDFVVYLRQFAILLKAGITILEATRILTMQTESKVLRRTLELIEDDLRAGNSLSAAYSAHKRMFSNMFISMVRAGETTGRLSDVLETMADYYEKSLRTRQKIQSAMAYPATVGVLAVCVVIFLLATVVPTFVDMFEQNDTELPWITETVIQSSHWTVQYWWLFPIIAIFLYINFMIIVRNKSSKYYFDYVTLKMPVFGILFQKSTISRMMRTLSSLESSAVPILKSLSITEEVVDNEVVARAIIQSRESLQNGSTLSDPMKKHWVFPALASNMIAVGEQTGELETMFAKVADFYEAEVDSAADRLKSLIEPVMVVFLSVAVGFIVLAIMVPLFQLYNNIG